MTPLEAKVAALLVDSEKLLEPENLTGHKWVILSKTHSQLEEMLDKKSSLVLSFARAHERIASLRSFAAAKEAFERDKVFSNAPKAAGYWATFEAVLQDLISSTGRMGKNAVTINTAKAVSRLKSFRTLLTSRHLQYEATARLFGVSLGCKSLALPDDVTLYRLNRKELNDRQPLRKPYPIYGFEDHDFGHQPAELRVPVTVPVDYSQERAFFKAHSNAAQVAGEVFRKILQAVLVVYSGKALLGEVKLKGGLEQLVTGRSISTEMPPAVNIHLGARDVPNLEVAYDLVSEGKKCDRTLSRALHRYILGRRRSGLVDKLVDYVIAWEAILLTQEGAAMAQELSYRFALNGASLLSTVNPKITSLDFSRPLALQALGRPHNRGFKEIYYWIHGEKKTSGWYTVMHQQTQATRRSRMTSYRTLFFGTIPAKSVSKKGHNRPVPDRRFTATDCSSLQVRFTNTTATQFGGYPLWSAFLDRFSINIKLAQDIKMDRGEGFTAPELSRFFVDSRILGADRLMHVDTIRHDPMITNAYGIDGLASNVTLGRYFEEYRDGHIQSLDRLNVSMNNQLWKKSRQRRLGPAKDGKIILDYDSTTTTVYGKQEGADRGRSFRKKDEPGFQPKFAFIGGLGVMINHRLCPQSSNLGSDFDSFHRETATKLPKTANIWAIRADGALYSEDRIMHWEKKGYVYGVSAKRTEDLRSTIADIPQSRWEDGIDDDGHHYSIARITYKPVSWQKARTFIISRRLKDLKGQTVLWEHMKYEYFAFVTNHPGSPYKQFKFCIERCSLENFIKETKNGFHYDFLPSAKLDVNRWTIGTLRHRILNICGNLQRNDGRLVLSLPRWWPWQTTYRQLAAAGGLLL